MRTAFLCDISVPAYCSPGYSRVRQGISNFRGEKFVYIFQLHLRITVLNTLAGVTDIYFSTFQVRIISISVQLKVVSINKHSDKAYICSTPCIGLLFNIASETLPVLLGFYCIVITIVPPSSTQMRSFVIAFVYASLFQMLSVEHVH